MLKFPAISYDLGYFFCIFAPFAIRAEALTDGGSWGKIVPFLMSKKPQ